MSRTLKRVPLDFAWPLHEVWGGYRMPPNLRLPDCPDCGGEGYGPEARAVAHTFYPHQISWTDRATAERLAWHDKIGQKEVDYLVAEGRLREWRGYPADGGAGWVTVPRTAAEVNARQRRGGLDAHDAVNRMLLVRFRCEALGIPLACPTCDGRGDVATPELRAAREAWTATEPPEGDGYQLWETVSQGSPISPVFGDADAVVDYLRTQGYSEHAARRFVDVGWAPSMVMQTRADGSGVQASNLDAFDLVPDAAADA